MARCSRVCGITPSSAATTSRAWSTPTAPAAMVWTNFSWPGTSMKPSTSPLASGA
jgi:hypothetical protein